MRKVRIPTWERMEKDEAVLRQLCHGNMPGGSIGEHKPCLDPHNCPQSCDCDAVSSGMLGTHTALLWESAEMLADEQDDERLADYNSMVAKWRRLTTKKALKKSLEDNGAWYVWDDLGDVEYDLEEDVRYFRHKHVRLATMVTLLCYHDKKYHNIVLLLKRYRNLYADAWDAAEWAVKQSKELVDKYYKLYKEEEDSE